MNANLTRKILIDTDTASDDAVALIMALRSPKVSVLAITVVAGNVSVEQGTRNALFTVELCRLHRSRIYRSRSPVDAAPGRRLLVSRPGWSR